MSSINGLDIKDLVKRALKEDIGKNDITTEAFIPNNKLINSVLLAKENCVVCGLGVALLTFKTIDKNIKFKPLVKDGDFVKKGKVIAKISGRAKSILTAERVSLNFLCFLSGISTKTKKFSDMVRPYKVEIMDTRKTIPLIRILQKYAVRMGGGYNHRMKLDEMYLVKDNHLKIIENLTDKSFLDRRHALEIEVKNLKELKNALGLKPDIIMLDNMSPANIKRAVLVKDQLSKKSRSKMPKLEASGGITLKNLKKVASCGVDMISVGDLTHSVKSVDISLEVV